jgi:hypothetical protein
MMEALSFSETSVLKEPHGITSQKMPFFMDTFVSSGERREAPTLLCPHRKS